MAWCGFTTLYTIMPEYNHPTLPFSEAITTTNTRDLEEFLILIQAHLSSVPALTSYVKNANIVPSMAFTGATISKTVEALNGSVDLTSDCIILSDLLKVYSYNFFNDAYKVLQLVCNIIRSGRTYSSGAKPLYKTAIDDFYFEDSNQLAEFLNNNELLVVVYIVSLINFIFTE